MKPVFRWTIGNCTDQGLEILGESVCRAVQLYEDTFDWYICHNNLTQEQKAVVDAIGEYNNVSLYQQHIHELPFPQISMGSPKSGGVFDWDGTKVGGTCWKLCPSRLGHGVHEIIMDNDVVFTEKIPEIDQFLEANDRFLILQDNVAFYGIFANYIQYPENGPYNSGLIGIPPNFYFGDELSEAYYAACNSYSSYNYGTLTQADEQGLVATVVSKNNPIVISNKTVVELLGKTHSLQMPGHRGGGGGRTKKHLTSYVRFCESMFSSERKGYHFCQANRLESHFAWELYKKFQGSGASILADFNNKEVERIARRGYVEGYYGTKELAKNWAVGYAQQRLLAAKD